MTPSEAKALHDKAIAAGEAALAACVPNPMIVRQHQNPLDDGSKVVREFYVADGPCGFAWINCKSTDPFILALRKIGLAGRRNDCSNVRFPWTRSDYEKAHIFWVFSGDQSIAKKEAFARAFAKVLQEGGVNAWMGSRLD